MIVLGMMQPIPQLLPKEGRYVQLLVPRISPLFEEPHNTQFSQDIDTTSSDDFYQVHQAKHNKKPSKPQSGFQRDHS